RGGLRAGAGKAPAVGRLRLSSPPRPPPQLAWRLGAPTVPTPARTARSAQLRTRGTGPPREAPNRSPHGRPRSPLRKRVAGSAPASPPPPAVSRGDPPLGGSGGRGPH